MVEPSQYTSFHLRSLTIRQYEQFQDCPPIEFSPGENLILGINGAGKTRLLWLINAILRFRYHAFLDQAFNVAFEIEMQSKEQLDILFRGEVRNQPSTELLEPPWGLDPLQATTAMMPRGQATDEGLQLHLRIETAEKEPIEYIVERGRGVIRDEQEEVELGIVPANMLLSGLFRSAQLPYWVLSALYGLSGAFIMGVYFVREADADFMTLVERLEYTRRDKSAWGISGESVTWWPLMQYMFDRVQGDQPVPDWKTSPIVCDRHGALAPLLDALGADQMTFRFKVTREDIHRPGYLEGRGIDVRVRFRSGVEVADSELTFGQKRLITIGVIALLSAGIPILVDELDNGLHPGMVEAAMGFIAGRQSFIASHNRLVVDLVDYDSPEDLQRKVHICRRTDDGSQRLVQLSDEEARDVFEKIDVGIMHPSDVLRTEGLW